MSLSDSKARLASAHRDLMAAWHRVSDSWHDDTARRFRERSIEPVDRPGSRGTYISTAFRITSTSSVWA